VGLKDRNIDYGYQTRTVYANQMASFFIPTEATPNVITEMLTGLVWAEVGALGLGGITTTTDGNLLRDVLFLGDGSNIDWANDVHARILWTDGGTGTDNVTWKFTHNAIAFGAAYAAATTVLDTLIAADPHCGVANGVNGTTWGIIDGSTITDTQGTADFVVFDIEMDTEAADIDPIFLGYQLKYIPKLTSGAQTVFSATPTDA